MSAHADPKHPDQNPRAADVPAAEAGNPSSRRNSLTTIGLCGLGMILVGSGMHRAFAEGWRVALALAGMLILILGMWMVQERWLTRERHRLITSALKRTGVDRDSGQWNGTASPRTRTRRGRKPVDAAHRGAPRGAGIGLATAERHQGRRKDRLEKPRGRRAAARKELPERSGQRNQCKEGE